MVVLLHCSVYGLYSDINSISWMTSNIFSSICHAAVPVFFMISGALYSPGRKIRRKKLLGLLLVYLLWTVIYSLYFVYIQGTDTGIYSIIKLIGNNIIHSYNHLWYLPVVLITWVLVPVIRVNEKCTIIISCIYFVVLTSMRVMCSRSSLPLLLDIANKVMCACSYFVVGYWVNNRDIIRAKRNVISICSICALVAIIILTWLSVCTELFPDYMFYEYDTLPIAVYSVGFFLLFKNISEKNIKLFSLSGYTFGIYLVHVLVRNILVVCLEKSKINSALLVNPIGIIIMSGVVFGISLVITATLKKIKYLNRLVKLL